ncbi:hypothetical protein DL766_002352 [Monosporascus sp. MC13-8B]|uniref:Copper homeostasis protein cutC homolog n=1 Tax=Monosporascus cannonballus TaxID=155416 RepID=A0ABY0HFV9_9PEZI|nr:hypothetical protein DL762_001601 [Monosporascus cannonballus]RYP00282.1 hypothetical protein DL763_000893 [Monosporascus cannonballus]RYP35699.1 hypothetical protein DL766_002352 [Monosporascus sp. MC13-8B]
MGGKTWSEKEEQHFWRVTIAYSAKRAGVDRAKPEKSWDLLAQEMQRAMGSEARRDYTGTMLFEHYFQNIESGRKSPNAAIYVREYQLKLDSTSRPAGRSYGRAKRRGIARTRPARSTADTRRRRATRGGLRLLSATPHATEAEGQYQSAIESESAASSTTHTDDSSSSGSGSGSSPSSSVIADEEDEEELMVKMLPFKVHHERLLSQLPSLSSRIPRMAPICLEIPVFGAGAAADAAAAGASRIELNAAGSYPAGGLTPSLEDLQAAANLDVPLRIMIRPRGPPSNAPSVSPANTHSRDFIYSDEEFEAMQRDIEKFGESGLLKVDRGDGFVFGMLRECPGVASQSSATGSNRNSLSVHTTQSEGFTAGCEVDSERCTRLVEAARPFKTVFHRAFDEIVDYERLSENDKGRLPWQDALDDLVRCGFDGILTSGGPGSAVLNVDTLNLILDEAGKTGIEIIVGGGIRSRNTPELLQELRLSERKQPIFMHSSCLLAAATDRVDSLEVEGILKHLI